MYLFDAGKADVSVLIGPTQGFAPGRGLRLGISIDDEKPQIVDSLAKNTQQDWERSVKNSIRVVQVPITVDKPGYHVLKFWMVDPAVVLEKLVVDFGGVKPSFLGPPESYPLRLIRPWVRMDRNFGCAMPRSGRLRIDIAPLWAGWMCRVNLRLLKSFVMS